VVIVWRFSEDSLLVDSLSVDSKRHVICFFQSSVIGSLANRSRGTLTDSSFRINKKEYRYISIVLMECVVEIVDCGLNNLF
jgi:hypothetical protein